MSVISIIPARGGSKSIPGKNIKVLNGKPLVGYTIEQSLSSKVVDRTIVSTDDEDIARVSQNFGAEVPFLRPSSLSGDTVPDYPVIKHVLEFLIGDNQERPEIILYLRPTMPTRKVDDINRVVDMLLEDNDADSVLTTSPVPYSPYWVKLINSDGYIEPYHDHVASFSKTRRQDHPNFIICDGYADAAKVESIIKHDSFPPGNIKSYHRENIQFIDLDTPEDWKYCQYYLKKGKL